MADDERDEKDIPMPVAESFALLAQLERAEAASTIASRVTNEPDVLQAEKQLRTALLEALTLSTRITNELRDLVEVWDVFDTDVVEHFMAQALFDCMVERHEQSECAHADENDHCSVFAQLNPHPKFVRAAARIVGRTEEYNHTSLTVLITGIMARMDITPAAEKVQSFANACGRLMVVLAMCEEPDEEEKDLMDALADIWIPPLRLSERADLIGMLNHACSTFPVASNDAATAN